MLILNERDILADVSTLDQAWVQPQTFVLLPDKCVLSQTQVQAALASLPTELQTRHFLLLTSGSTGNPKLIVASRERAERLVQVLHQLQDSECVKQTVLALPLTYCYAFVNQWLWSRFYQRRLAMNVDLSRPDQFKQALSQADHAMLCLVGVQVPLIERYLEKETYPGIIRIHFAGGRFPQEKLGDIHRIFPRAQIFNNYGCAEAMPRLTLRRAEDSHQAGNIGKPLPGILLEVNGSGELAFKSPYGAVGYVDANGFHRITSADWVATGDLAERCKDGSWQIVGRANEVFKRYGEKIALPTLMQTVAACWDGVAGFYRETDANGENGHVLMLAPQPLPEQVRSILRAFRVHHSRAHWPLRIESVPALPFLPNGKIDRLALPQLNNKTVHWHQRV